MAEHTPGPWAVETPWSGFSSIRDADGNLVFGIAAGGEDEKQPDDVCAANARLIAASPRLLEALCHLVEFADRTGQGVAKQVEDARAAIASAKGK